MAVSVVFLIARDEQRTEDTSFAAALSDSMAGARRMPLEVCTCLRAAREMLQASAKKPFSIAEKRRVQGVA
ncbi:hypothetical protein ABIE89_000695 [Bradyrhizobium niftali]